MENGADNATVEQTLSSLCLFPPPAVDEAIDDALHGGSTGLQGVFSTLNRILSEHGTSHEIVQLVCQVLDYCVFQRRQAQRNAERAGILVSLASCLTVHRGDSRTCKMCAAIMSEMLTQFADPLPPADGDASPGGEVAGLLRPLHLGSAPSSTRHDDTPGGKSLGMTDTVVGGTTSNNRQGGQESSSTGQLGPQLADQQRQKMLLWPPLSSATPAFDTSLDSQESLQGEEEEDPHAHSGSDARRQPFLGSFSFAAHPHWRARFSSPTETPSLHSLSSPHASSAGGLLL